MADNSPSKMLKFRNLLWKLHYKLEKRSTHTSFDKLTDDPRYRAGILAQLIKSEDERLSELAGKIIEQEIILGIHYEFDDDELITSSAVQENTDTIAPHQPQKTSRFNLGLMLLLLISLSVIAYSLFIQPAQSTTVAASTQITPEKKETIKASDISVMVKQQVSETLTKLMADEPPEMTNSVSKSDELIPPAEINTVLRLHGSNTVGEKLAPALVEAFLRNKNAQAIKTTVIGEVEKTIQAYLPNKGWIEVEIQAHGSSTSFKDMDAGSADMGMASRKIKDKEVELLHDRFGDLTLPSSEHVLGLDGLAIIVNKANPISQLNSQQLAGLFSGEIKNWSYLGGPDLAVTIYARDGNSGTWDTFKNLVLKKYSKKLSSNSSRYESSSELSDLVAEDTGAIGFIGLPYVRHAKLLAIADDVDSQAIIPTLFTVGTEDYPLSRRLYFYTPAQPSPFMRDFVEFTHSNAGQQLVKQIGFISQNIYTVKPSIPAEAPALYKSIASRSERLSLNFRFKTGSNDLDNKSVRDLDRLTNYIANNPEKQLSLFGFSDSVGDETFNTELSQLRAQKIESELHSRGIYPTIVKGFGENMPVASNVTKLGRNKNRRVEIWVNG